MNRQRLVTALVLIGATQLATSGCQTGPSVLPPGVKPFAFVTLKFES